MDNMLTVKEVAEKLGVTTACVRGYHKRGLLPFKANGKKGKGEERLTPAAAVESFKMPAKGRKGGANNG